MSQRSVAAVSRAHSSSYKAEQQRRERAMSYHFGYEPTEHVDLPARTIQCF